MLFPSFPSFCNGVSASEELLLQLEHRVGNQGEPVGVKTPLGWTIVQLTPEERAGELMRKMCDEDVMGISDRD